VSGLRLKRILLALVALAFTVRLAVRLYMGEADFWVNGYSFFAELARNITAGNGLAFDDGTPTAFRVPGYPLFLAVVGQNDFSVITLAQSLIGAGTVFCSALIARVLFGNIAALIAASITAVYPYYVVHDTALQETGLATFLTVLGVLLLLRARRDLSVVMSAGAGIVLAGAILTRANLAAFALLAPVWLLVPERLQPQPSWRNFKCAGLCAAVLTLAITPWLIRSYSINGSPTLSGETGYFLWLGNNAWTFSRYPVESIDGVEDIALPALDPIEQAQIEALRPDARELDRWYFVKALRFIREHPWQTIINDARKVEAAFGLLPSPRRALFPNLVHALSYGSILLLGLWGMWTNRQHWREHLIFYALFASFVVTTAVFFGHTSYRAYLDVYLIIFTAGALVQFGPLQSRAEKQSSPNKTCPR
jgi:4-amino-4-deoxy-L-arabinose transferase-like glycosyltransferase